MSKVSLPVVIVVRPSKQLCTHDVCCARTSERGPHRRGLDAFVQPYQRQFEQQLLTLSYSGAKQLAHRISDSNTISFKVLHEHSSTNTHEFKQSNREGGGRALRREVTLSRWPWMKYPASFSCFATSFAEEPDTSIQVFEKRAHAASMKAV
jgi:hypothetical protein